MADCLPPDLAELTGESRWQVGDHLRSVTGRSLSVRDGQFHPDHPVYLLGHEEIQVTAIDMLGPDRLAGYRERLHSWADRYRTENGHPTRRSTCCGGTFGVQFRASAV